MVCSFLLERWIGRNDRDQNSLLRLTSLVYRHASASPGYQLIGGAEVGTCGRGPVTTAGVAALARGLPIDLAAAGRGVPLVTRDDNIPQAGGSSLASRKPPVDGEYTSDAMLSPPSPSPSPWRAPSARAAATRAASAALAARIAGQRVPRVRRLAARPSRSAVRPAAAATSAATTADRSGTALPGGADTGAAARAAAHSSARTRRAKPPAGLLRWWVCP